MGKQQVLIVDDRPANLVALERILAETGAEVVKATSGEKALAATLEHDFALAILDVQMPGMDGYELAELLRGDPKSREMPIVFLTAASLAKEQIFKGYESGAVDYIVKPYEPAILISKVKVFLELHARKEELRRRRRQLAEVNRELEAFTYSVSHDLRAPLRAIEGFSRALMEDCPQKLDDREREYLERISGEAGRMSSLIDGLLTLSRATRAEMGNEPVDLGRVARGIVDRLEEADPDRAVDVRVADDLVAEGDPVLLGQALENLLSNAWKFSAGQAEARIEVGAEEQGDKRVYFVRDNGAGFDMKYADELFVPFQRLHSDEEFSGSGVGLSTVQRIVKRHGGRVWAESRPGEGSTFFFTLDEQEGMTCE